MNIEGSHPAFHAMIHFSDGAGVLGDLCPTIDRALENLDSRLAREWVKTEEGK